MMLLWIEQCEYQPYCAPGCRDAASIRTDPSADPKALTASPFRDAERISLAAGVGDDQFRQEAQREKLRSQ